MKGAGDCESFNAPLVAGISIHYYDILEFVWRRFALHVIFTTTWVKL